MKINDVFARRIGPLQLGGWLGICFAIISAGVIRSYFWHVWPEKTNGDYLQEVIETSTVQKMASVYVATLKKANAAPTATEAEWIQIEKGLSECVVKQAGKFLGSGDPYLIVKADKTTPLALAKRFLDACDLIGLAPAVAPLPAAPRAPAGMYDGLKVVAPDAANDPFAAFPVVQDLPAPGPKERIPATRSLGIPAPSPDDLKAASQGDPTAQYAVAIRYTLGAVPNDKQAAFWFETAARQGHAGAQYELGAMYFKGQGVAKDYKQAAFWFQKAAEQGDQAAQYDSGLMFYRGEGVAQDYVEAHKWWNLAGRAGDERAKDRRDMVEQMMTTEQIAEAQRRASEWAKRH